MASLLYPEARFLLSVVPPNTPDTVVLTGLILHVISTGALAVTAAATMFLHERRPHPVLGLVRHALWTMAVLLLLYDLRILFAAYYRAHLLTLNTAAVHLFYGVLLFFSLTLARINRAVPSAPTFGHFAFLRVVGGYLYLIGWTAFVVAPVNTFIRVLELGALLMLGSSFVQIYGVVRRASPADALRRLIRRLMFLSLAFLGIYLVTMVARYIGLLPAWFDMALVFPLYVLAAAGDGVGFLWRQIAHLTGSTADPAESNPPEREPDGPTVDTSDADVFASRMMDELALSPRERDVLEGVRAGKSNRQIAAELAITEKTVRNHVSSLYRKTETRNRVELVYVFDLV